MAIVNHLRNLLKHSAIYSMATFLQRFIGLLMLPFLTNPEFVATKAEFANFTLYYTFISFTNILFLYGMDAAFLRFSILGKKDTKTIFSSTFYTLVVSGLFLSTMIWFFKDSLGSVIFLEQGRGDYLILAVILLFTDSLSNVPYLLLRVTERSMTFSGIKIFRFVLELVFNIVFVIYLRVGWIGMVYGNILAAFINLLILVWINRSYFLAVYDFPVIREMLFFGLPFIPNSLAYMLIELVDRLIVPNILSKEVLAVYAANYRFGMVMGAFILAFRNAWQPFFLKTSKEKDAKNIFGQIFSVFISVTGILLIISSYLVPSLIQLKFYENISFLNESYWEGLFIIPMLLSAYFLYGIYVYFTLGVYIEKKSKLIGIFTFIGALTNIVINLLLLDILGILGAAVATVAAYGVMALLIFLYNQKIYKIELNYNKIIRLFISIIVYLCLLYIFDLDFIERLIILVTFPFFIYVIGGITKQEIKFGGQFIKKMGGHA